MYRHNEIIVILLKSLEFFFLLLNLNALGMSMQILTATLYIFIIYYISYVCIYTYIISKYTNKCII